VTTVSENPVTAPAVTNVYVAAEAPVQHQLVPGETEGFRAPGGALRPSLRDRIAARRPFSVKKIYVESWDEWVEVRSISLGVRNEMMERVMDPETKEANVKLLIPELLIQTAYDPETGERIFADDDIAFVNGQDSGAADEVAKIAMELSGMTEGAKDEAAGKSSETATSVSASS
jgi:hypothetical protein